MSDLALTEAHVEAAMSERPSLRAWHATSWAWPLAAFVATFGMWLGVVALGLWVGQRSAQAVLVVPLAVLSGQLFTIAHDAGHGSYSTSPMVNAIVGRLALVPSVHVFGLWQHHHDLHHRFTNLRSRDFVWTPPSVDEYRALPAYGRALHRVYRHASGVGLGLHYAVEIWAPRMLWPRSCHRLPNRGRLIADALLSYALLAGTAGAAWALVSVMDPSRGSDLGYWTSAAVFLFVLPLIGTQWLIGFVIYLNHTHPDVVWHDDADEWARHDVQLEGSTGLRFHPVRHALLPRRIMNHTAHHVDPGVPLRRLATAQRQLVAADGDRIVSAQFSWRWLRNVLRHCQLYDYDAHRWIPYPPTEDSK